MDHENRRDRPRIDNGDRIYLYQYGDAINKETYFLSLHTPTK